MSYHALSFPVLNLLVSYGKTRRLPFVELCWSYAPIVEFHWTGSVPLVGQHPEYFVIFVCDSLYIQLGIICPWKKLKPLTQAE